MTKGTGIEEISSSGRVGVESFKKMLGEMKSVSFSGVLSIKARQGYGAISLKNGVIVSVTVPDLDERMKRLLVSRKLFTEQELLEAEKARQKRPSTTFVRILKESGLLPEEQLVTLFTDTARDAISTLICQEGVYFVEAGNPEEITGDFTLSMDDVVSHLDGPIDDILELLESADGVDIDSSSSQETTGITDHRSRIAETISQVAKSISTYRPREIVILVEDEAFMRQVISDGLQRFGFEVESFENPRETLESIRNKEMEHLSLIIVLDLMMTGLYDESDVHGGIDLLDFISQHRPSIPVVITTALDDPDIRLKTLFLGASGFVSKPTASGKREKAGDAMSLYINEIALYVENIFRKQQAYLEKEQLLAVRDELLQQMIKKMNVPIFEPEEVFEAGVLLVDDTPEVVSIGQEFLLTEGFKNVDTAKNGAEAVQLFDSKRHDVVVTDIVMPEKNGIEILKYVKIRSPHTQVIIITGNSDKNSAIAALKLGAYDYLEKPIDFEVLPKTVSRAVELKFILDNKM